MTLIVATRRGELPRQERAAERGFSRGRLGALVPTTDKSAVAALHGIGAVAAKIGLRCCIGAVYGAMATRSSGAMPSCPT